MKLNRENENKKKTAWQKGEQNLSQWVKRKQFVLWYIPGSLGFISGFQLSAAGVQLNCNLL